ncbi:hypothetical protein PTQ38_29545, partial [Klebsiella michiganensis]|nr:hypothetical protein [Klebsiella michiganensis]
EWVHVQLHQQKGMISLSPPTICNSATGMPETRLTGHDEWSAVSVFRKVWRRERALRAAEATRNREWNQLVIPDGMSNQ